MTREILGGLLCITFLVPPVFAGEGKAEEELRPVLVSPKREGESPRPRGRGNPRVVPPGKAKNEARKGRPQRIRRGPGQWTARARGQLVMWPGMNGVDTARYAIAHIYLREAKWEEAIKQLRRVTEASPTKEAKPLTHWNIGNIYRYRMSDRDKAIKEFKKIEGKHARLGNHAIRQMNEAAKRYEKVIKSLRERISKTEDKTSKARLFLHMGALQQRMGKSEEAIATFNEIISNFSYEDLARMEETEKRVDGEEQRERLEMRRERMRKRLQEWREKRDREDEDDEHHDD